MGAIDGDGPAMMMVREVVFVVVSGRVGRGVILRYCWDCGGIEA